MVDEKKTELTIPLFAESFTAVGATLEQVRQIFAIDGIRIVMKGEI